MCYAEYSNIQFYKIVLLYLCYLEPFAYLRADLYMRREVLVSTRASCLPTPTNENRKSFREEEMEAWSSESWAVCSKLTNFYNNCITITQ